MAGRPLLSVGVPMNTQFMLGFWVGGLAFSVAIFILQRLLE